MTYRIVHYINQFFAGIGGEEKAGVGPESRSGALGPGMAFKAAFGNEAEIVGTVICGTVILRKTWTKQAKRYLR